MISVQKEDPTWYVREHMKREILSARPLRKKDTFQANIPLQPAKQLSLFIVTKYE